MLKKIHIISSFMCLNCCNQHRLEIGLPQHLALMLKQTTFDELMDQFPEVIEELVNDEFQNNVFHRSSVVVRIFLMLEGAMSIPAWRSGRNSALKAT